MAGIEVESKFHIFEPHTEKVTAQLEAAEALGGFKLGPIRRIHNHDTYFDTIGRDLARMKGSLRTRLVDGENYFITLKLPTSTAPVGEDAIHSRSELEAAPTAVTMQEVWQRLQSVGLARVSYDPLDVQRIGAEGILRKWGMAKRFEAENGRVTRSVLAEDGQPFADLSLDSVVYHYANKESQVHEIEIEALTGGEALIPRLSASLRQEFAGTIEPSYRSKYDRGLSFIEHTDDNRNELKFVVDGSLDEIGEKLQLLGEVAGYRLDSAIDYHIADTYFDAEGPELRLWANQCYLRLRMSQDEPIVTFRAYRANPESFMIETHQIKEKASKEALLKVYDNLCALEVIEPAAQPNSLPEQPQDILKALGFQPSLAVKMERRAFPVYDDEGRAFANIKLDGVTFSRRDKERPHNEIEISASLQTDLSRVLAIADALEKRFPLHPINLPKYQVGMEILQRGKLVSMTDSAPIQVYARANLVLDREGKSKPAPKPSPAVLRTNLTELFSEEELRTLCFDLRLDYDGLEGRGKEAKVRELIRFLERRGRLEELINMAQILRDNVSWE